MVKLDIRQESARHSDVLDTITQYLGLGSYKYCSLPSNAAVTLPLLAVCSCVVVCTPTLQGAIYLLQHAFAKTVLSMLLPLSQEVVAH